MPVGARPYTALLMLYCLALMGVFVLLSNINIAREACGSGACAAVVAAMRRGAIERTETPVEVVLDGGSLTVYTCASCFS